MKKYYLAYGSNLSFTQMAQRCPDARPVGTAILKDWRLVFKYHATIVPCEGFHVPLGVWEIGDREEAQLDRYEGYPGYYQKQIMTVIVKTFNSRRKRIKGMIYIMNDGTPFMPPTLPYYYGIKEGYADFRLNSGTLSNALRDSFERS